MVMAMHAIMSALMVALGLCDQCGEGEIRVSAGGGRTVRLGGKMVPIPDDRIVPTCDHCNAVWLDRKDLEALLGESAATQSPDEAFLGTPASEATVFRHAWTKLDRGLLPHFFRRRRVEHVLSTDPMLCTLRDADTQGARYLAARVDLTTERTRWIQTPLSELEWHALLRGALSLRDALCKFPVWVVDYHPTHGVAGGWRLQPEDLPRDALPPRGVALAEDVRARFAVLLPPSPPRALHVASPTQTGHRIPLGKLGRVTRCNEAVYNALALAREKPKTRLDRKRALARARVDAVASLPGSFAIELLPSDPMFFERVSEDLARLAAASDDPAKLKATLKSLPGVEGPYHKLLAALRSEGIEVMLDTPEARSFVGEAAAARIAPAITKTHRHKSTVQAVEGYFLGFSFSNQRFEFYDQSHDKEIRGSLDLTLFATISEADEDRVTVGYNTRYRAEIAATVTKAADGSEHVDYELRSFDLAPQSSADPPETLKLSGNPAKR